MSMDQQQQQQCLGTMDAAPMPIFMMRPKKSNAIRTNPRPYSCDVAVAAARSTVAANGRRVQNVYQPTHSVMINDGFDVMNQQAQYYPHRPQQPITQPHRLFERKSNGLVSRFGQAALQKMSQSSTPTTKKSPSSSAVQYLLRSSSQHELQKNHVHVVDPASALIQARLGYGGSSPSVPRVGTSLSTSALLPSSVNNVQHHMQHHQQQSNNRNRSDTEGSSSTKDKRGSRLSQNFGLSGSSSKGSSSNSSSSTQPAPPSESASILKRLRFVGQRTASAISSAASSTNTTPPAEAAYRDMLHAPSAAGGSTENSSTQYASISSSSCQSSAGGDASSNYDDVGANGTSSSSTVTASSSSLLAQNDWRPPYPRLCAYHDCLSLASAWGLGPPTTTLDPRPTGASQAQSPCEDDAGDGKSNHLLASCPAFRNELGAEPIRRLALSRHTHDQAPLLQQQLQQQHNHRQQLRRTSIVAAADTSPSSSIITLQREHTAAEAGILEDVSNVYLGGRLCADRLPKTIIEPQDIGSYYYRHCFAARSHYNYFGTDENYGPIAISMIRESIDRIEANAAGLQSNAIYRLVIRISDLRTIRVAVPEDALPESSVADGAQQRSGRTVLRDLLELVCPQLSFGCLRLGIATSRVEDLLLKLDEQPIYTRYKVGIMYCKTGQSTEEQMYNNEHGSEAFDEFLDFLGQRVRLKGFEQYKGGLDTRGDTTGTHSVFAEYQAHEIMFHVSTMLPFTPSNRQQLSRKRHIGNDMVTIVFQEPGALPFSPITVRSHFQHVFIIVRVISPCTENVNYSVAVSRAKDVPTFGPPIPPGGTFSKCSDFLDFLLTKIINAENAVHRSKKFAAMAARTRREALKDLAENHVTAHSNDGASRIASRFLGGSVKRKDKVPPRPILVECIRGALSWEVSVFDYSLQQRIACILGISAESIVLLERPTGIVVFATPTHSIIGWAVLEFGIRLYYDHGQMLELHCVGDGGSESTELPRTLLRRLEAVTKGCETQELLLRRNNKPDGPLRRNKPDATIESFGFHLQDEGVVTDVDMYQTAWRAGLRQGSRIVEIEGLSVCTMTLDRMDTLLKRDQIRLLMILPAADGSPRRGCEDPHCPAVRGQDDLLMMVSESSCVPRQPPSYETYNNIKRATVAAQSSPGSRTDQGYESAGWCAHHHQQQQQHLAGDYATVSSASSNDERWSHSTSSSGAPTGIGKMISGGTAIVTVGGGGNSLRPSIATTDTLSSSGSASSELSDHHLPPQRRPNCATTTIRSINYDLSHTDQQQQLPAPCPPLPPKTYKNKQRLASVSIHERMADILHDSMSSNSGRRSQLNRTHSEELLTSSNLSTLSNHNYGDNHSYPAEVVSARPAIAGNTVDHRLLFSDHQQPIGWDHPSMVEKAAEVLAKNPEIGTYQLRLQAALQKARLFEEKYERVVTECEKERRLRKDLEAQITLLKDDRKIMERERRQLENELRKFMFHHQVVASPTSQQQPLLPQSPTTAPIQPTDNNRRNNSLADF